MKRLPFIAKRNEVAIKRKLGEKKKKKNLWCGVHRDREEEENKQERCRATRVAGICCRYIQVHRFAKTRPTISCRALALKKISWKNHKKKKKKKKKKKQHKNNKVV